MTLFQTKCPPFMARLMADVSCGELDAAAVFGNIGHECNGFRSMQEIGQVPPHGGYSWQQWTGARRTLFMAWCAAHSLAPDSDEAAYTFLVHELLGSEHASLIDTKAAIGLDAKTDEFEKINERAGVPALASRRNYAHIALLAYDAAQASLTPTKEAPAVSNMPILQAVVQKILASNDVQAVATTDAPVVAAQVATAIKADPSVAIVSVTPDLASPTQWAQIVTFVFGGLATFGFNIPDATRVDILAVLTGAVTVFTYVRKRWFTTSISPGSAAKT